EALRLARKSQAGRRECLALEFLGETKLESGEPQHALPLLDEALGLAERLSGAADLMMEVLRRRGETYLAIGRRDTGRADLERTIRICSARGERREGLLTERAHTFAFSSNADLPRRIHAVFMGLQEIEDSFESLRTVVIALERGLRLEDHEWLHDAYVSAAHYVSTTGLEFWRKRLEAAAGYLTALTPKHAAAPSDEHAPVQTKSFAYKRALDSVRVASRSDEP